MRYLLIQFVRRPGGQIDEQVTVTKRIKPADLQTMNVILDYKQKKIEKCVVEGGNVVREWDVLNEYYRGVYPQLVAQLEIDAPNVK